MRSLLPHITTRDLRQGPFTFALTDLHGPNIFVDSRWNIKYNTDLVGECSLPIEMLAPRSWITNLGIDEIVGKGVEVYGEAPQQLTELLEELEKT